MIAEFVQEVLSHGTTLLLVRSAGASVASEVTVTFDRVPPADVDALPDSDMWKWLYQRYSQPVPTWAPGWTLSNVIRAGHDPLDPTVGAGPPRDTRLRGAGSADPVPR